MRPPEPEPDAGAADAGRAARRGLGLIIHSGDFGRVHYALLMASAALAVGRPAILFFTMDACRALAVAGRAGPGWHDLGPDSAGRPAATRDNALAAAGIATFETLLGACRELGATFMACETGLRACGLVPDALRQDLAIAITGVVSFYQAARAADILFI
ncbi:MAG: hypothetical protein U1E97_09280 [Alphaproteobacteria bacterium]